MDWSEHRNNFELTMMGNVFTYIWNKFSSLFGLLSLGRGHADEDTLSVLKADGDTRACEQRERVTRETTAQSHEKILSEVRNLYDVPLLL